MFLPPGASLDVTEALSSRKYEHYAECVLLCRGALLLPPGSEM